MSPALLALLPSLGKAAQDIIRRAWPDQAQADEAARQFGLEFEKLTAQKEADFRAFIVAYEGQGDKVHPALQILRGSVRPVVTYALAAGFLWGFFHPADIAHESWETLKNLNYLTLSFWFGERALGYLIPKLRT